MPSPSPALISAIAQRVDFLQRCSDEPFTLVGLRKFVLTATEIFFADEGLRSGMNGDLQCLVYNPADKKDNTVFIDLDGKMETKDEARVPLVTAKIGDFQLAPSGLNNTGDLEDDQVDDGATENLVFLADQLNVSVEAKCDEYDQALAIAEGLLFYFIGIRRTISGLKGIRRVLPIGIVMPKLTEKAPRRWVASVNISLTVDCAVTVREESALLKKAVAEVTVRRSRLG